MRAGGSQDVEAHGGMVYEADPRIDEFDWHAYVAWLVASHGTLTAVASRLSEQRGHREDVQSIERGLRRLRNRGTRDGGSWASVA